MKKRIIYVVILVFILITILLTMTIKKNNKNTLILSYEIRKINGIEYPYFNYDKLDIEINKIIKEENPSYVAVAFDVGKNFRKKEFSFYKEGRQNTPDELKMQMPYAREILTAMGIKYLELEPYEADDIIGTLVKMCAKDADFDATIISSDKDLLQLINFETDVKLLKQTGFIRFNEKTFKEEYGVDPINMIDLKALMGDSSDNIPGVKGIGEKGAIKLLKEYQTIENLYEHIDEIKGSTHDKLVTFKENAFMSKKIATIYCDVPLEISLNDLKYDGPNNELLYDAFSKLEFTSLLSGITKEKANEKINFISVNENINVVTNDIVSLYIECDNEDYTCANIVSISLYDGKFFYFFSKENIKYLIIISFLIIYIFLTDYQASVLRSVSFFVLSFINKKYLLNIDKVNLFFLSITILMLIFPNLVYDVGFLYSTSISFTLIRFSNLIKGNYIISLIIISIISFLVSLPITINNNYEINIFSIINNLFIVDIHPVLKVCCYYINAISIFYYFYIHSLYFFI